MSGLDLKQHLLRQMAFSHATFGPGRRCAGVIDHIRKELREVEQSGGSPQEWADVVILALDGLTRALGYAEDYARKSPAFVADLAIGCILDKQDRNEGRVWPDWRRMPEERAIEHINEPLGAPDTEGGAA